MKILTSKHIRILFCGALALILLFCLLSLFFFQKMPAQAALCIFLCGLFLSAGILILNLFYFYRQNRIMEQAVQKLQEYRSGNAASRIECDEEGELYRLFHEVNTLVSALNAHAEHEQAEKIFLKNTISDISHQLKTPLAALNIYNGILKDDCSDAPTVREFANLSEQELDRIDILVKNLLKITKFDAGTITLQKRPEQVSELMECVQKHFSFRAGAEKKQLLLSGDEEITLLCDREWLLEALDNIVKNALDHTKPGDRIRMEWSRSASVVQIVIKDNGCGIHPEDLYHIFKRFYRSRFSKDTQGLGLGLPLSKAIVEAHGGTIEVDSELNRGSSFMILIPTKL